MDQLWSDNPWGSHTRSTRHAEISGDIHFTVRSLVGAPHAKTSQFRNSESRGLPTFDMDPLQSDNTLGIGHWAYSMSRISSYRSLGHGPAGWGPVGRNAPGLPPSPPSPPLFDMPPPGPTTTVRQSLRMTYYAYSTRRISSYYLFSHASTGWGAVVKNAPCLRESEVSV